MQKYSDKVVDFIKSIVKAHKPKKDPLIKKKELKAEFEAYKLNA